MNETSKTGKGWLIAGVAILIAVGVGLWLGRPAYRRFKEERSLVQARTMLQKGNSRGAAIALRQTLTLNPANVEAARLMAELAGEAQLPVALPLWRRVVELSPTFDNKVLLATIALRVEKPPFPIAAQTLDDLRSSGETNTAWHLAASQLAIKLNRIADAEAHLQAAARLQPANRLHQLNLATLRLQADDPSVANAARRELAALISDSALGEYALRSLIADALLHQHADKALQYSRQLQALPKVTFADRLQHLAVLQEAGSAGVTTQMKVVQEEASRNVQLTTQTLSWMGGHGLASNALSWLSTLPVATRSTMPVPLVEADCYIALRDWRGLSSRLNSQQWDEHDFIRMALLARGLREQGQTSVADVLWRRAAGVAAARPEFTAALAQTAMGWGWNAEAEALLWAAAKKEPSADWSLQALLQSYSAGSNTAGLYRVHLTMLERNPNSPPLKNNVAMFALLLNQDLPRAMTLAREVYESGRTNAIFVSTYAYALHLRGQTTEALALMRAFPEMELQRPEIAIYYAVLLSASGERTTAKTYIAAAECGPMLPEERRLLNEAR